MANTRYRRGSAYAADMAVYARSISSDNSAQLGRLKKNLVRALQEDVTDRQREFLLLYYAQGLNMRQIGERLGVDSRSVHAFIIGEHGDSELPVWSSANISGVDLGDFFRMHGADMEQEERRIYESVRDSAYEIIEKRELRIMLLPWLCGV